MFSRDVAKGSPHLTFVRRTVPTYAAYRCSCGVLCEKRIDHVNSGNTISCGHLRGSNRNRYLGLIASQKERQSERA